MTGQQVGQFLDDGLRVAVSLYFILVGYGVLPLKIRPGLEPYRAIIIRVFQVIGPLTLCLWLIFLFLKYSPS